MLALRRPTVSAGQALARRLAFSSSSGSPTQPASAASPTAPSSPASAAALNATQVNADPSSSTSSASASGAATSPPSVGYAHGVNPMTGKSRSNRLEVERGSFWELKDIGQNKGKVFDPIAGAFALNGKAFPSLPGLLGLAAGSEKVELASLLGKLSSKPCTLVAVSFKQFGFEMIPTWLTPFDAAFPSSSSSSSSPSSPSSPAVLQLAISDGGLLSLFSSLLVSSMRGAVPPSRHACTYLFFGDNEAFRQQLNIENRMTAYVFLLDRHGCVKFRGSGKGGEGDIKLMLDTARAMVKEEKATRTSGRGSGESAHSGAVVGGYRGSTSANKAK